MVKLYNQPEVPDFRTRIAYTSGGLQEYVGKAVPHAEENEDKWQIIKMTYDSNNRMTQVDFANGTDKFDKKWSDRATYSYS